MPDSLRLICNVVAKGCLSLPHLDAAKSPICLYVCFAGLDLIGTGPPCSDDGTAIRLEHYGNMFFFFSNGIGLAASLVISAALSVLLLYACS
jgi:hypothetical protein